jgi:hypothetical protein
MKHTTGTRAAAVAAAVLAAGLATAGPANAAALHTTTHSATRITGQEQLHASILAAVTANTVCSAAAGFGVHPMGGYPPPPPPVLPG